MSHWWMFCVLFIKFHGFMIFFTGMHTFVNGTYTGIKRSPSLQEANAFCFISAGVITLDVDDIFFICTGVNDHEYVIYDPRDDSEEDWDYWNLICRVIFSIALLCPYLWLVLYINNFGWAGFFPSPKWWSFWMQNLYNVVLHQSQILSFKKT